MKDKDKVSISFVVHKGALETQSLLLASSIQFHNENEYDLFACIPKEFGGLKNGISKKTKQFLSNLGVKFVEVSNPIGKEYLIGNKLGCLNSNEYETRVFLDTDILCCKKLTFPCLRKNSIAIKPADRKTNSWNRELWQKAYKKYSNYELMPEDIVKSTAFDEMMLPYFNAGVIAIRENQGFCNSWVDISKRLDNDNDFKDKRPWLDQLSLPLAIKKAKLKYHCLTEKHNFPANIKPVELNSELVHYHRPDLISRNSKLINSIRVLINKYPWLNKVLGVDGLWKKVIHTIEQTTNKNYFNPPTDPRQSIIITGIPRSGTSYFCSLLEKSRNCAVINEPVEVLKSLKKRYIPWGVAGYYSNIRRDLALGVQILNKHAAGEMIEDTLHQNQRALYTPELENDNYCLATKNTLGYITSIPRLLLVLPDALYIGIFRNPIDTIASWKTSFEHLKLSIPNKIKIINENKKWLNNSEISEIDIINDSKTTILRQALFWNFLASQLLKHRHSISLLNYKSIIQNPNEAIKSLDLKINTKQYKPGIIRFKSILSEEEKQIIMNVTAANYNRLKLYAKK